MSESVDPAIVTVRFIVFGLALLLFGGATFAVYAPPEARPKPGAWTAIAAPVSLALAAAGYLGLLAREASGAAAWPPLALVAEVGVTTGFGRALATTLLMALGLAAVGGWRPDAGWARAALSGAGLAALALVGHAADDGGVRGAARLSLMALHLLAIGVWLGALPWLWRALRDDSVDLLSRFGLVGGVSVALVLASGLGTVGFVLADAHGGLGAGYARILVLKLAFVLGLLALAAVNRFWLTPRMSHDAEHARLALRRTILLEQAMGLGALASVALLGQLDPTM